MALYKGTLKSFRKTSRVVENDKVVHNTETSQANKWFNDRIKKPSLKPISQQRKYKKINLIRRTAVCCELQIFKISILYKFFLHIITPKHSVENILKNRD